MDYTIPRCRIIPQANQEVSFQIDGGERTRWHFHPQYERPFFYPFTGPGGAALTRIGHPGAPNHDHHRSIWFAHHDVVGVDFWSNTSPARIRQQEWLCYQEGNEQATMAVRLQWSDGHDPKPLLHQTVIAAVKPGPDQETFLEIQTEFRPVSDQLEFRKTNFGFLAVRMSANLSEHFGGGVITNSHGKMHEANIFGKPSAYMDYSGPIPGGNTEGITYYDHASNPGYPNRWHVREDGWMGCALCMDGSLTTTKEKPLTLRFLIHAHAGGLDANRAEKIAAAFNRQAHYELVKRPRKHTAWGVQQHQT